MFNKSLHEVHIKSDFFPSVEEKIFGTRTCWLLLSFQGEPAAQFTQKKTSMSETNTSNYQWHIDGKTSSFSSDL